MKKLSGFFRGERSKFCCGISRRAPWHRRAASNQNGAGGTFNRPEFVEYVRINDMVKDKKPGCFRRIALRTSHRIREPCHEELFGEHVVPSVSRRLRNQTQFDYTSINVFY